MIGLRRLAVGIHAGLAYLFPEDFRRRYGAEMRLDFIDQLNTCATAPYLAVAACRAYGDIVISAVREWQTRDVLRMAVYAGLVHTGIWLAVVAIAAWQWPGGARLSPLVLVLAVTSVPGIAVSVWRQRLGMSIPSGCCSRLSAELD